VLDGQFVSRKNLFRIVPAAIEFLELLVRVILDQFEQLWVLAEEVFADVGARHAGVLLVLAVDDLGHALGEQARLVAFEQRVPVAAPNDFDDVPSCSAKDRFEFLDDFAVASDRPVEPLEIAIDDEDQIVEFFARCQSDRSERLWFVAFSVAEKRPNLAASGVLESPIVQVLVESSLIDRHDRPESHRDGRIFPEVGHEPRVGVAAQSSFGLEFAAKILQLVDRQSTFDERTRVHARRGVALEVNQIPLVAALATSSEEMVEGDLVEGRTAGEGADMATLPFVFLIGPNDHGHRIPANDALDPSLGFAISRISGLFEGWYGVDVRCRRLDRDLDPIAAGSVF